ncbi:hypothetical protein RNN89_24170, partial [Escherichia coli]|nr:hypothetical protein [Escherichia coli]
EKRVFLVILFTSFSGSLVSRIPGAVQWQSYHSSVLSGNKNGENKTGMAVSVTAMFISQYAGKNHS